MPKDSRDSSGRFIDSPDSLGKTIGLRVRRDLEPALDSIVKRLDTSKAAWCREIIEKAIEAEQAETLRES
jgi:predicted DNA-binding protein